jgi:hypothetical protein
MPMDRRQLILTGAAFAVGGPAFAQDAAPQYGPPQAPAPQYGPPQYGPGQPIAPTNGGPAYSGAPADTYSRDELVGKVSDFFGVTAENAAAAIEKAFRDQGQPTGYVAGEEGSAAIAIGVRYGKGQLYMKNRQPETVYWQGPSVGWDFGGNASRVFTLCYNLQYPDAVFRRFPGVEGSAYLVGGMGLNYQKAEDITLAPIRAGMGLRLGANVGYLSYSRKRNWFPV